MTFKLKALAAAAMVVATAPAFAAIADGTTGNGELLLTVWDQAGQRSYTRDLGITINDFGTANRPTGGFTTNVDTGSYSLSLAPDATWATFVGTSNPASFIYDIVAIDSDGNVQPDRLRFLSTSTTQLDWSATGIQMQNSRISQMVNLNDYINGVNQAMPAGIANNSSVIQTSADNGYAGGFSKGVDWGTQSSWTSMQTVGQDAFFYYITRSSTSAAAEGINVAYGNALGPATWNLANNGTLTFTAPIPEPSAYAMMALGLVALGAFARKARRKS